MNTVTEVVCIGFLSLSLASQARATADLLVSNNVECNVRSFDSETGASKGVLVPPYSCAFGDMHYRRPDNSLYLSAHGTDEVLRFDLTDKLLTPFVSPGSGGLDGPAGITFGPDNHLYVVSNHTSQVITYDSTGNYVSSIDLAVVAGAIDVIFGPEDDCLYVSFGNPYNDVRRYDITTGESLGSFIKGGEEHRSHLYGLAFGPGQDYLYVVSNQANKVLRYDGRTGDFVDVFIPETAGLNAPQTAAYRDGYLFVNGLLSGNIVRSDGTNHIPFVTGLLQPTAVCFASGPCIQATVDAEGDTLNLKSKGVWITCYIELPEGYDVGDIAVSTIMLDEQVAPDLDLTDIGDYDGDAVADLMVKFDRSAVQEILEVGDAIEITVTGQLTDGTPFEGTDMIRVISPAGQGR